MPIGGGGPLSEVEDAGLEIEGPPVFRKFATEGANAGVVAVVGGGGLTDGKGGAAFVGGLGAAILGGFGAENSGSDVNDESRFAVRN